VLPPVRSALLPHASPPFGLRWRDTTSSGQAPATDLRSRVHDNAVAAELGPGTKFILAVREKQARYTGNVIPLVMSRT
jgi:hypothetical protein